MRLWRTHSGHSTRQVSNCARSALEVYAEHMRQIARVRDRQRADRLTDRSGAVCRARHGAGRALILALRRLAQEEASARRFG